MKRFQARKSNGRFQQNTMENTFGLHTDICPNCRQIITWNIGQEKPKECHQCKRPL
jgi:hypothetical protein